MEPIEVKSSLIALILNGLLGVVGGFVHWGDPNAAVTIIRGLILIGLGAVGLFWFE